MFKELLDYFYEETDEDIIQMKEGNFIRIVVPESLLLKCDCDLGRKKLLIYAYKVLWEHTNPKFLNFVKVDSTKTINLITANWIRNSLAEFHKNS